MGAALLAFGASAAFAAPGAGGWWQSEGYGWVFQLEPERLNAFEVTAVSCLPTWSARRDAAASSSSRFRFRGAFESGEETVEVDFASREHATLRREENTGPIPLTRLMHPPERCLRPPQPTPLFNFDVLWATFSEQYPSFAAHGIDWDVVKSRYRSRIGPETSPNELFSIFEEILLPLEDKHVVLEIFPPGTPLTKAWEREPTRLFQGAKQRAPGLSEADRARALAIIESYLGAPSIEYCSGRIRFGVIAGRIGYLEVLSFHDYVPGDNFREGFEVLQDALGRIFASLQGMRALIVDVRLNHGGDDPYGLELAGNLTKRRYPAWRMRARLAPDDRTSFGDASTVFVSPARGPIFEGDVALLIGPGTASAGETFALSLLGRTPSVLKIGGRTEGVFSDVLDRRLPNGWRLVLPNQLLFTEGGESFDVLGVPPDLPLESFSREDLDSGRDPAIEAALRAWGEPIRRADSPH